MWFIIHTFYNRISYLTKVSLDSTAGGVLMNKRLDEAQEIIESVILNHHQWTSESGNSTKVIGKYDMNTLLVLGALKLTQKF